MVPAKPLEREIDVRPEGVPKRIRPGLPTAPDDGLWVSKEVYWRDYYDRGDASYEWNNGYLEAKGMSTPIQLSLYGWFLELLRQYVYVFQNAQLLYLETAFELIVPDPKKPGLEKETIRKPDVAVVLNDNPIPWLDNEKSYHGTCDLCVESLSDSNKANIERDTKVKMYEYNIVGVKEYYILDPDNKHMHFYERTDAGAYVEMLPDSEGVLHSRVLPGFQFRMKDLERQPALEKLALDPVYQGYVLLEYQASERRAEQEKQRAEQEKQRADTYRARLLELGIDPDNL
ncbi:Uma2 family endonuclease [Chloroflexi bacterium TSY]|nr:Uma2 family endonuclease [Chloroflexi bacterium TSY]